MDICPQYGQMSVARTNYRMSTKEDRAEVTLGNLIKIPPNLLLDLSPITMGRIKMFLKFIFLCLQNMVSGQQEKYIIIPHPSQPLPS